MNPSSRKNIPTRIRSTRFYFTTEFVQQTLIEAGYDISMLGVSRDPAVLLDGLRDLRPDVVFNLFEGLADFGETEAHAAGILEWLEIPYTGCPYQTLCLARGKHLTKHLLAGAGLPTAKFFVVEDVPVDDVSARLAGDRQAGESGRQHRRRSGQRRDRPGSSERSHRLFAG